MKVNTPAEKVAPLGVQRSEDKTITKLTDSILKRDELSVKSKRQERSTFSEFTSSSFLIHKNINPPDDETEKQGIFKNERANLIFKIILVFLAWLILTFLSIGFGGIVSGIIHLASGTNLFAPAPPSAIIVGAIAGWLSFVFFTYVLLSLFDFPEEHAFLWKAGIIIVLSILLGIFLFFNLSM